MTDYRNYSFRLVDIGLNLRDTPDKVNEGKWRYLNNVKSAQEGSVQTRDGLSLTYNTTSGSSVHSLRRLDNGALLVGTAGSLYANETLMGTGFSGEPLSIIPFKPFLASTEWAYVGDFFQMKKVRSDGKFFKWGITAPAVAPTFIANGVGNLDSTSFGAIVYDWRYTYYSTITGAESNPSETVAGIALSLQQASISVVVSADPQVDQIRVYRRGGVNGGSVWRLSATSTNIGGSISDNAPDSFIALNDKLSLTNDVPFTSVDTLGNVLLEVPLPYTFGPFVGKYILACGDTNRPGYVYWTNPTAPDGASPANNLSVCPPQEALIGGVIYSSLPYVFSQENLYALDYGGPLAIPTFVPRKTPCGYGAVGPWAFCAGPMIYFVGRLGIYATSGQDNPQSITEDSLRPLFHGETIGAYSPIDFSRLQDIQLNYTGEDLHFFYIDTVGNSQHLIWNTTYQRWRSTSVDLFNTKIAYQDENANQSKLFLGGSDGKVYQSSPATTTDNGHDITSQIQTGSVDFSSPQTLKEYGNLIVDADPLGGTITVTPYLNTESTTLTSSVLTGTGRQKFPISLGDAFGYSLGFAFSWTGPAKLYQFDVLWHEDEELIKHWQFPPTTHRMSGWQHVRDGYITIRTTDVIVLTVTIDGVDYNATFTAASTNTSGEKRKLYFTLPPAKGKMFQYAINSNSGFRLYGTECEIRAKQWNTSMGYQLVSPFTKIGSDGSK